jgi:predicted acylesterase/phospholipase RssA
MIKESGTAKSDKHKTPHLGLALSGGASRGITHVGVLKAFHDTNVKIDCLSGTSIGALVAALYAFGIPVEDIHRQALEMNWLKISSLKISRSALDNRYYYRRKSCTAKGEYCPGGNGEQFYPRHFYPGEN